MESNFLDMFCVVIEILKYNCFEYFLFICYVVF